MLSRHTNWRGTLIRLIALATLALALATPLAMGMAPEASAAPTACGTATSGCGPQVCALITPKDYTLPATSPRGGVRASLSRTHGVTGTALALTGSGWPAFATVEIFLGSLQHGGGISVNPTPFAQGVVDTSGHPTIPAFHAPPVEDCTTRDGSRPGDNQTLFIVQTPDGKARVSLLFTYGPTPYVNSDTPEPVTPGEAVTLNGLLWEPGQMVTITPAVELWPRSGWPSFDPSAFQPLPADALVVKAEADGAFTGRLRMPQEPPEALIMLIATAKGPRNGAVWIQVGNVYAIGPSAMPTLAVSHASAFAGERVTVSGANWPVNQDIQIEYCRGRPVPGCQPEVSQTLALVTVDASGRIAVTVQIPPNARPGPITIQARALTSPFGMMYYDQARPFAVLYPFAQAHPRIELALRALPYAIMALLVALIALGEWLGARRRARLSAA